MSQEGSYSDQEGRQDPNPLTAEARHHLRDDNDNEQSHSADENDEHDQNDHESSTGDDPFGNNQSSFDHSPLPNKNAKPRGPQIGVVVVPGGGLGGPPAQQGSHRNLNKPSFENTGGSDPLGHTNTNMNPRRSRTGSMAALKLTNNFTAKPLDEILRDRREEEQELNLSLWDQGSWRSRLFSILEPGSFPSHIPKRFEVTAMIVSFLMMVLIFISCLSVMGESYPEYVIPGTPVHWAIIEIFTVVIFSAEIILRFITSPNRFLFFVDVLNIVDLVVVLPFYLELANVSGSLSYLRMLRVLRLARLVRVLKTSHVMGLNSVISAVQNSVAALFLFVALAGTTLLIVATCMYFAERGDYFDKNTRVWYRKCLPFQECGIAPDGSSGLPSPFQSIPDAFWYTIVTMSTVGFSDQYPTGGIGQLVGACTMLIGVLFIAFPTMVLSGHYDLSSTSARVTVVTWRYVHDQNIARLAKRILPARTRLMIARGWATEEELNDAEGAEDYNPEGDDTMENAAQAQVERSVANFEASQLVSPRNGGAGSGSNFAASPTSGNFGKKHSSSSYVAQKARIAAAKVNAGKGGLEGSVVFSGESNVGEAVALFRVGKQVCELRPSTRFKHRFLYSPLYKLRRAPNGDPRGTVLFGTSGMPTLVQFDLLLDTPEARKASNIIAQKIDPKGTAAVDLSGGLQIRHHSPLQSLEACGVVGEMPTRYEMHDFRARNGIRSMTSQVPGDVLSVPIYFSRVPHKSADRSMVREEEYLRKEDVLAECLASVMSSSLLISALLPGRVARKRAVVVSQMIQNSRLHREVEFTSARGVGVDAVYDEKLAYFSYSDILRLMEGVHRKVDLYDPSLYMIEPAVVDFDITRVIIGRLRHIEVNNVLPKYQGCIYNAEVLSAEDLVYEIPLSLFAADDEDVVEEDSLGYIEVTTYPAVGSHLRLDFSTDFSGIEGLTNAELRGGLGIGKEPDSGSISDSEYPSVAKKLLVDNMNAYHNDQAHTATAGEQGATEENNPNNSQDSSH